MGIVAISVSMFLVGGSVQAHGPGIDYVGGKLILQPESPQSFPVFVYSANLAVGFVNLGWGSVHGGGNLVVGDEIGLEILDGAPLFGLPTTQFLFYHDGTSIADPGSATLQALGTSTVISKSALSVADVPLGPIELEDGEARFHAHLGVLLNGGSAGAYAFWATMTTSNDDVASSDPYLVVLNNSLDSESFGRAIEDFADHVAVPEASSLALAASASVFLGCLGVRLHRQTRHRGEERV